MPETLTLLPLPRQLILDGDFAELAGGRLVQLYADPPQSLLPAARRFVNALQYSAGLDWQLVAGPVAPAEALGLVIAVDPQRVPQAQGYQLEVSGQNLNLHAHDPAGAFYGVCTLIQLLEQYGRRLPCLRIDDWPDFPARGVMLDISRDKVPTLATLFDLVDLLAGWKVNQFQLYTEHTFAYRQHPEVWAQASPLTGEEILELDAYCRERYVELVPNQNSFGHFARWLIHPRYAPLAEVEAGFDTPWGHQAGPFSLNPVDPGSLKLLEGLYDELLPHFTSKQFNAGCDETFDLGQGRSKPLVEQLGAGRVYLDFLLKIYQQVRARGYTLQYWGDIIVKYPDLIPELPKDAIALEWGYEADHPFAADTALFESAGVPFYVCPGTSSWNSLAGRSENAIGNLLNAAENGLKHGAFGYLNTDWGDNGHWQPLPVSYLGFAAGAAYSWSLETNRALSLPTALDRFAFRDRAGVMGHLAFDLGNIYQAAPLMHNSSALFWILQTPLADLASDPVLTGANFPNVLKAIESAVSPLSHARIERQDSQLLAREFNLVARLLRHACQRGMLAQSLKQPEAAAATPAKADLARDLGEILVEYAQVWLARNRYGGLPDSLARFEKAKRDYASGEIAISSSS